MPPPQQDKDVTRDYRVLKLRLTDVKKTECQAVISNNSCKTQVLDGTAMFLPSLEGRGSKGVGDNHYSSSGTMCHLLPHRGEGIKEILKHGGQSDVQDDENNFLKRTYSHIHLFTYSHRKRPAFTLAEILITLGIIGVVAAMTIPSLIADYQKKRTVTQLKATYSIIAQTLEKAKVDYGTDYSLWQGSSYTIDDFNFLYSTYFAPYIETFDAHRGKICDYYRCASTYKTLKGTDMYQHDWSGSFYLKNGSFIHIHPYHCGIGQYSDALYIDVNGPEHGPNILGKDVFDFMLTIGRKNSQKNGIFTTPCDGYTRDELLQKCSKDYDGAMCNTTGSISCCSTLIMQDGWEIKDNYPF